MEEVTKNEQEKCDREHPGGSNKLIVHDCLAVAADLTGKITGVRPATIEASTGRVRLGLKVHKEFVRAVKVCSKRYLRGWSAPPSTKISLR